MTAASQELSLQLHSLQWAVQHLAQRQGQALDRLALSSAIEALRKTQHHAVQPWQQLEHLCAQFKSIRIESVAKPSPEHLPCLALSLNFGWVVLTHLDAHEQWHVESTQGQQRIAVSEVSEWVCAKLSWTAAATNQTAAQMLRKHFSANKTLILEGAFATVLINLVALASSFYSMQVYDRVIPSQGYSTLVFLSMGVGLCIVFELMLKVVRSKLMEHAVVDLDARMSRDIFQKLLAIRLDQLPPNVGSLAGQLRSYESIRALLTASTLYLLVDLPFAVIFVLIIALLGTPVLLWVPLGFFLLCLGIGLGLRRSIQQQAAQASQAGNLKTGLLVEAVEGAETIKSAGGQWRFLARWLDIHAQAIVHDLKVRHWSEIGGYATVSLQQLAYAALVALGAWQVIDGHMSMGALIACTMLSGRALAPAAMLCSLLAQNAHAKAALNGLEKVYSLQSDHHGISQPLRPEKLKGNYKVDNITYRYPGGDRLSAGSSLTAAPPALQLSNLNIPTGQRLGVLGPVGCGKSTLLKLLAGLYAPTQGRILLDDLDISHISRPLLSEQIGYLQQEHRLFQGSLRDNLLLGLPDPGDSALLQACQQTGLLQLITAHPRGLELPIAEGGKGLSGGQKQLVALTRMLLAKPRIWLLDEPTAHLDDELERRCILSLAQAIEPGHTVVIVTHKPALLALVNQLMVLSPRGIVLQGSRDEVLAQLRRTTEKSAATPAEQSL